MSDVVPAIAAAVAGLITLAMIAVIFAPNATTAKVLTSAGTSLQGIIGTAVSPVMTGNNGLSGATP